MAIWNFDADGTTANRAAVPLNSSATANTTNYYVWVNNTGSAVTIQYTISADTVSHEWNETFIRGGHAEHTRTNVRRYGDTTAASDGTYVATLPAGAGGVVGVTNTAAGAQGIRIAQVTDSVKPIRTTHRTSGQVGGDLIITTRA